MTALEPVDAADAAQGHRCGYADCRKPLRKCHNFAAEAVCNRCYVPEPATDGQQNGNSADAGPADRLCAVCQLTKTIPDLSVAGNREKWARLEAAKRRLLYTLDRIGLPYSTAEPHLTFEFKANVNPEGDGWHNAGASEIVYTGHCNGVITINIREADDAVREQLRCQFQESQRTLIGHLHHEIGHYYWDVLVKDRRESDFRRLFGDHNAPPYQEAISAYYQNGPNETWRESFISAYASAHPWEDFAETFALYLDMISTLDTATHLFKSIRANFRSRSVLSLVERYQEVGILVNEFNRTIGLIDLLPDVISRPVVEKLEFIHSLVRRSTRPSRIKPLPARQPLDIRQPVSL